MVSAVMEKSGKVGKKVSASVSEHLQKYVGDKISVICARYQYWGVLSEILGKDAIVLADSVSVEQSGASSNDTPQATDPIGGSVVIMMDAIEIVFQPNWSKSALPSESE